MVWEALTYQEKTSIDPNSLCVRPHLKMSDKGEEGNTVCNRQLLTLSIAVSTLTFLIIVFTGDEMQSLFVVQSLNADRLPG